MNYRRSFIRASLLSLNAVLALIFLLRWGSPAAQDLPPTTRSEIVPLVRLLAIPEAYHGKRITTMGVVGFGRERSALYISKEHADVDVGSSAIWLQVVDIESSGLEHMNGKYVLVEGTFDARGRGHLGSSAVGTIREIKRIFPGE